MDNIASSMTYAMRMAGGDESSVAYGIKNVIETVVHVDWAWMSLPFVVEALVLLYLVAMIVISRGIPAWRNQTLATLCHGLDYKAMADVATLQSSSEMDRRAKHLHVRLVTTDNRSRFTRVAITLS